MLLHAVVVLLDVSTPSGTAISYNQGYHTVGMDIDYLTGLRDLVGSSHIERWLQGFTSRQQGHGLQKVRINFWG